MKQLSGKLLISFMLITVIRCSSSTETEYYGDDSYNNGADLPYLESLVFWVSNGVERIGQTCRKFSLYYCLESYRTPSIEYDETIDRHHGGLDPTATSAWFNVLIRDKWQIINMIDPEDPNFCCSGQTTKYLMYGHLRKKWDPQQYMDKLMEYWDEDNKPLNYLIAVYIPIVCCNLIVEVGFGPGNLTRNFNSIDPGAPFVILGSEFDEFGIPGLRESPKFDFYNPGRNLTFHWFKHNIMCLEHPWICGNVGDSSKPGRKGKGKKGSKKSRRKNNQSDSLGLEKLSIRN
ncbi:uncharacterized protein LOC142350600 [Convolutriloba macropyga]|uniref:uncharacterized protein LOC142350600 n=1 Tax=Convolutriloba macropyga TaxID=536237 RepID=UPI003F51E8E7